MDKKIVILASIFGLLAVALGAFGAHGLKKVIDSNALITWEKAVQYQFYHVFALLFLSVVSKHNPSLISLSALFFVLGICLFSGSLYVLATKNLHQISTRFIGPITPIGGLLFILGWATLFLAAFKNK